MPNDNDNSNFHLEEEVKTILSTIADMFHKMRWIKHLTPDQQSKVAIYTKHIYAPIAHRLGLGELKAELEDLYLEFSAPPLYHATERLLGSTYEERKRFIHRFQKSLKATLQQGSFEFTTKARVKSITSILDKLCRLRTNLEEIYDIFAIRIILNAPSSQEQAICWQAYDILNKRYKSLPKKFRDWLTEPRPNGYQALHITLMDEEEQWVEVQIRTKKMDDIAEKGSAAHWKYKEDPQSNLLAPLDPWLAKLRTILEQKPQMVKNILAVTDTLSNF